MIIRIVDSERKGLYIEKEESKKEVLEVEKIFYPLGNNYGNTYWDGVRFSKGRKKVKVEVYGGGNGWARRGSMTESWDHEDIQFIEKEEFEKILQEIQEIEKETDEVDKQAMLRKIVDDVFTKYFEDC